MNNFRKEYRETENRLYVPNITAMSVMDEERRKSQRRIWKKRRFAAAAGAACILMVGMAGTATAVSYTRSVIRVTDNGFSIVDDVTAGRSGGAGGDAGEEYGGVITPEQNNEYPEEQDGIALLDDEDGAALCDGKKRFAVYDAEECEVESAEYNSLEQLREGEPDLVFPVPDLSLLGEKITYQQYLVFDMRVLARIHAGEKIFLMNQTDYRDTRGHAAAVSYAGTVCNERKYSTGQGYTYTVIDSVNEEEEHPRIHAAISVNDYELIVDFIGYTEDEAYQILEQMNLGVYF